MKLTVNIFKDFINTLTLVGEVTSFSDDGTSTTISVNATFHVRRGMSITINAVDFLVKSVVIDTTIIITGLPASIPFYSVAPPFYFHGTPIGINQEINEDFVSNKAPMIYLYEAFSETDMDENSSIKRESKIRLFFLDTANFEDWATDDYYSIKLEGLNSLVDQFLIAYKKSRSFRSFDTTFDRTNFVKWGVNASNKGSIKNIFDDELTGVELTFTAKLTDCEGEAPPFIPVCPPPDAPPTTFDELVALIGRGYNYPQPTSQTTSFKTGDDADIEATIFTSAVREANSIKAQNSLKSGNFLTLNNNNEFGNTNRFTDLDGLQVFGDDYAIDHYTGLGWRTVNITGTNWNNSIDNALASSLNGFSDWFIPDQNKLFSIWRAGSGSDIGFNYTPFSFATFRQFWSSTSDANPTGNAITWRGQQNAEVVVSKTSTTPNHIFCRKHF